MNTRKGRIRWLPLLVLAVLLLGGGWLLGPSWRALLMNPPLDRNVLSYNQAQRDAVFRLIDQVPFISSAKTIAPAPVPRALPEGTPLSLAIDLDRYVEEQRIAGLVILQNGKLRMEQYGLGFGRGERWTSFSVAKSLTAMLVGAAIADGAIKSMQDSVTDYLPALANSAYATVTVEQLLTMTSGVAWNEDYENPNADVARFDRHSAPVGKPVIVSYLSTLDRAHPPGQVWNYSTGETNLIGALVAAATGTELATYLQEKVWHPGGMSGAASWILGTDGFEISGCCIQATTRDFARFGQFVLEAREGQHGFPAAWAQQATTQQVDFIVPGQGYGYQWWTYDDGSFQADGIFGQGIFIDPARQLVIASNSSWRSATGERAGEWEARRRFYKTVQAAVDADPRRN